MGYHSINRCKIERVYSPRLIIATVYCEELDEYDSKEFPFEALDAALAWVKERMMSLSM